MHISDPLTEHNPTYFEGNEWLRFSVSDLGSFFTVRVRGVICRELAINLYQSPIGRPATRG